MVPALVVFYLATAALTALGVAWTLTSVASDYGPSTAPQRVAYALMGVLAGLGWPLLALGAAVVSVTGIAH